MRFQTIRNEEPADAREALQKKYYLSQSIKNKSLAIPEYRQATSLNNLRSHSGTSSQPFHSIPKAPSSSPSPSPPSLVHSLPTSRSVSPIPPDLNYYAENCSVSSRAHEEEYSSSSDAYVYEYQRTNLQRNQQYEQLAILKSKEPRFEEGGFYRPLCVDEKQVEYVLHYWEKGLGLVPTEDIYNGMRTFEAGVPIDKMKIEFCAALVHILAIAIAIGRLPPHCANPKQIENYLAQLHDEVRHTPDYLSKAVPVQREHWLLGTAREREHEILWLGEQAEGLFWNRHNKTVLTNYQRSQEPSDRVLENMFDTYIRY